MHQLGYFNSIKVRLELVEDGKVAANVNYFNSIKVRLELNTLNQIELSYNVFQFHKGTIRTQD